MAISRSQIPRLLEPGLGRGWGKKTRQEFQSKAPNAKKLNPYYKDLFTQSNSKKAKV